MEQGKNIIFEYYAKSILMAFEFGPTKILVYDDGYIENQVLDIFGERIFRKIKYGKSKQAATVINDFYNSHKNIIDSIPSELDNTEVLDGCCITVRFFDKCISGYNILDPVSMDAKEYDDINKFIKLFNEFVETLKQYPCFKRLVKVLIDD